MQLSAVQHLSRNSAIARLKALRTCQAWALLNIKLQDILLISAFVCRVPFAYVQEDQLGLSLLTTQQVAQQESKRIQTDSTAGGRVEPMDID